MYGTGTRNITKATTEIMIMARMLRKGTVKLKRLKQKTIILSSLSK